MLITYPTRKTISVKDAAISIGPVSKFRSNWYLKVLYLTSISVGSGHLVSRAKGLVFRLSTSRSNWNLKFWFLWREVYWRTREKPLGAEWEPMRNEHETQTSGVAPGWPEWETTAYPLPHPCSWELKFAWLNGSDPNRVSSGYIPNLASRGPWR